MGLQASQGGGLPFAVAPSGIDLLMQLLGATRQPQLPQNFGGRPRPRFHRTVK